VFWGFSVSQGQLCKWQMCNAVINMFYILFESKVCVMLKEVAWRAEINRGLSLFYFIAVVLLHIYD